MADFQILDRIDNRWDIEQILGGHRRSGTGIVYVVYDRVFNERLAAKTFQDEVFARNPAVADRFIEEARAWIGLDHHPNVVRARFVADIRGKPYLFMDYVDGGDIRQWLRRRDTDTYELLRFAIELCDGMTHALSHGVRAHRDLKPENCLIARATSARGEEIEQLKVSDFGSAAAQAAGTGDHARTPPVWITPQYCAPELLATPGYVDPRVDIYAFGVMLFEMLTGQPPFTSGQRPSDPPPLRGLEFRPVAELNAVVQRCLQADPDRRFDSFEQVRERLAVVYQEVAYGDVAPPTVRAKPQTAVGLSNKAGGLIALGDHKGALKASERAVELDPELAAAWGHRAIALAKLGRQRDALESCDRATTLTPDDPAMWSNKAGVFRLLRKMDDALRYYDRAIELGGGVAPYYGKALLLQEIDRCEEALVHLDAALVRKQTVTASIGDVSAADILAAKARTLTALDRLDEAIDCCDRALQIEPRNPAAWHAKAMTLCFAGQFESGIRCFNEALSIYPYPEGWFHKGSALCELGRIEEGIACYDRSLQIAPRDAFTWFERGRALDRLGRNTEAEDSYRKAVELTPAAAPRGPESLQ